jgi:hypothetical protein
VRPGFNLSILCVLLGLIGIRWFDLVDDDEDKLYQLHFNGIMDRISATAKYDCLYDFALSTFFG